MSKKPEFVITKRWKNLSKEEQVEKVRFAMEDKHTNRSAALALGTTPGTIAGIRHRNDIPAQFKELKAKKPGAQKQAKALEKTFEPPEAESKITIFREEAQEVGHLEAATPSTAYIPPEAVSIPSEKPKLAVSEASQCTYVSGHRCAWERLPGSGRCHLHPHAKFK